MTHQTTWDALRTQYFWHIKGDLAGGVTSAMMGLPATLVYGLMVFAPLGTVYAGSEALAGLYAAFLLASSLPFAAVHRV